MKKQYEVDGWLKMSEEDKFNEGCLPETSQLFDGNDRFTSETKEGVIEKILSFSGMDKKDDPMLLNSCEEDGRVDIQGLENGDGTAPSKNELALWKKGECRLWCVTYTFNVEEVSREAIKL